MSGQERLSLLAAAQHLEGHHPWLVWADDRDHILAALDFADKHGLRLVLAGMQEGWMVADRLATCGHQLVLGSPFQSPDDELPYDAVYANAAALHRAGCRFAITTRSSSDVRNLPYLAAMAVAHGLPRAVALRALTLHGAEALGISGDRGTLRVGQVANVLLYDGDPLDARVSPRHVFIRGTRIPLISRHTYLAEPYLPR